MNRWTGTAHLTRDPELVITSGGTEICAMRIAVKLAGRDGEAGFFDVKAFGGQAVACAEYLAKGREVGLEGRLRFEEFETKAGVYAQRVYLVADQVEFLGGRRAGASQTTSQTRTTSRPTTASRPSPSPNERPSSSQPTRRPAATRPRAQRGRRAKSP